MAPWQPSGILKLPGMSLNTVLAISSGDSTEHREYNSFTEFRTGKHVCVCVCVCVCACREGCLVVSALQGEFDVVRSQALMSSEPNFIKK